MKKLLLSIVLLTSAASFAANLTPKYECTLGAPFSTTVTVHVSEKYLCGSENTEYEMAILNPAPEGRSLGSIDITKDGQENNSTFKAPADVDESGNPVFVDIPATCKTIVSYDMDC